MKTRDRSTVWCAPLLLKIVITKSTNNKTTALARATLSLSSNHSLNLNSLSEWLSSCLKGNQCCSGIVHRLHVEVSPNWEPCDTTIADLFQFNCTIWRLERHHPRIAFIWREKRLLTRNGCGHFLLVSHLEDFKWNESLGGSLISVSKHNNLGINSTACFLWFQFLFCWCPLPTYG